MPGRIQDHAADRVVAGGRVVRRRPEDDADARAHIARARIQGPDLEALAIEIEDQTGVVAGASGSRKPNRETHAHNED